MSDSNRKVSNVASNVQISARKLSDGVRKVSDCVIIMVDGVLRVPNGVKKVLYGVRKTPDQMVYGSFIVRCNTALGMCKKW